MKQKMNPNRSWLTLFILLVPLLIQAQEEEKFIGEVRLMNVIEAECTLQDGMYEIRFRDAKKKRFPKYKSFYFPDEDKNYQKLKNLVLKGFDSVPEEPQPLDFTEEKVEIQFRKSAGLVSFRFAMHQEGKNKRIYSSWFIKSKAEKIFGI
jgi:hypothetical protein